MWKAKRKLDEPKRHVWVCQSPATVCGGLQVRLCGEISDDAVRRAKEAENWNPLSRQSNNKFVWTRLVQLKNILQAIRDRFFFFYTSRILLPQHGEDLIDNGFHIQSSGRRISSNLDMAKMRMVEKLKIETGLSNDATSPAGGWIPWKTFCRLWIDFSSLELLAKPNWTHRIWYMCSSCWRPWLKVYTRRFRFEKMERFWFVI